MYQAGTVWYATNPGPDGKGLRMCKSNERVASNVCVPCPVGYANEGGDNPAGADTVCDGDGTGGLGGACDAGYHPSAVGDACGWDPYCEITVGDYASPERALGRCSTGKRAPLHATLALSSRLTKARKPRRSA